MTMTCVTCTNTFATLVSFFNLNLRFFLSVDNTSLSIIENLGVTPEQSPEVLKKVLAGDKSQAVEDVVKTTKLPPETVEKALDQIQKAKELARDTIGMKNPAGQIKQADAMEAAALREIERIRKAGGGKLPDLMPDKLTPEQIQQAMREAGLGSLFKP